MSSHDGQPYELLSSLRFDRLLSNCRWNDQDNEPCSFLLLRYHLDRLADAAERHGWNQAKAALTYDELKSSCHHAVADKITGENKQEAIRLRLTLSQSGELRATATPTTPFLEDPTSASLFNPLTDDASLFGSMYSIHLDTEPTATSIFTFTKTTRRHMYDNARSRVGLPIVPDPINLADVLIYNRENMVMESSILNVAFFRESRWVTPTASTGCLPGTFRRWLLEQGRIVEDVNHQLMRESVKKGEWVLLFNGVQGCRLGRIV